MSSSPKMNVSDFRFGVELEINIDIDYFWDGFSLVDGWRCHEEHCGTEIVSPPLRGYAGLMSVRKQLRQLHKDLTNLGHNRIKLDDAGLHVHVDIQHYTLGNAKRLLRLARRFDDVMFGLMDGARFSNRYTHHMDCTEEQISKCMTIADLQRLQADERYSCVNMYAFPKHGTVEFRYAGATISWRKMYSLISLYLRMVALGQSNAAIPERRVATFQSSGPKYAKKLLAHMEEGKEILFDTLQLKGDVRRILDSLFEQNKESVTKSDRKEPVSKKTYPAGLRSK